MNKTKLLLIGAGVVVVVGAIVIISLNIIKPKMEAKNELNTKLLRNAETMYKAAVSQKKDLATGPCLGLANDDYVVDTVHNPRTADDDNKANQCESYTLGQAKHLIELDLKDGKLVRMK